MNRSNEIDAILDEIQSDHRVQEMKEYTQHGSINTYDHCESVARLSYAINSRLSLGSDVRTLVTGAMLHDFYLYDWHGSDKEKAVPLHGFTHPEAASRNAREHLDVDEDVSRVIDSHMWPLTITRIPRSREAWIVCVADKWVSFYETFFRRKG